MAESKRNCELCNAQATIHCPCDAAYLCRNCDRKVHSANFLVARHLRSSLCSICGNLDGKRFSGAGILIPATNLCTSCSPENFTGDGEIVSVSSSSCVSSTTDADDESASSSSSSTTLTARREKFAGGVAAVDEKVEGVLVNWSRREKIAGGVATTMTARREKIGGGPVAVDSKVEGVLVNWCRKMAVDERRLRQVVPTAMELLGDCFGKITIIPFRVSLTTSFWVALRVCSGGSTCRDLRRLEQISGVPAKLVLTTESRLARGLKRRRSRDDHVEGWAEC